MPPAIAHRLLVMTLLLVSLTLFATTLGAMRLPLVNLLPSGDDMLRHIWLTIRLPRVLLAAFLFIASFFVETSTVTTLGPEFMPRLISVVIVLLGLLNLNTAIRDFKFLKDHGQLEPYEGKKTFKQLFYDNLDWVSGVLMLVYVFSIGSLGFLLPSIVYMFLQILLYTTMGKRNYLVAILSSVLIPCAVYFLFRNYFFLMLPKGILG